MGAYKSDNENGYQSPNGSEYFIPGADSWRSYIINERPKAKIKMTTILLRIGDLLGIGGICTGLFGKIDSWKELIVFGVGISYAIIRTAIAAVHGYLNAKEKMLSIRERERKLNK